MPKQFKTCIFHFPVFMYLKCDWMLNCKDPIRVVLVGLQGPSSHQGGPDPAPGPPHIICTLPLSAFFLLFTSYYTFLTFCHYATGSKSPDPYHHKNGNRKVMSSGIENNFLNSCALFSLILINCIIPIGWWIQETSSWLASSWVALTWSRTHAKLQNWYRATGLYCSPTS